MRGGSNDVRRAGGALVAALAVAACAAPPPARSDLSPQRPVVEVAGQPWDVLGASLQGRPVRAATFGRGPRRIYLIGGIHGDERGGVENADRLTLFLAGELPRGVQVRFVPDMNPDGSANRTRANARGVDLNRNWPASNFRPSASRGAAPLSEPEAAAVHRDLARFDPELVLVLHAARAGPFVNYDGPARAAAERFAAAAGRVDERWRVVADMGYPTPGSLGSLLGRDRETPILTVELPRSEDGESVWPALRAGLAAALE